MPGRELQARRRTLPQGKGPREGSPEKGATRKKEVSYVGGKYRLEPGATRVLQVEKKDKRKRG